MAGKFENTRKKRKWPWILGLCVLVVILILMLVRCDSEPAGLPTLTVETPQKLSVSETEAFALDVTISELGDALYPAMSMSIGFDSSRLEFLGIGEGNVFIHDDQNSEGQ